MTTSSPSLSVFRQSQSARVVACGRLMIALIILVMIGLIGRVLQLKISPDPRLAAAVGTSMSSRTEVTRRGDLLDRAGRVIATSTVGYRLFVDPRMVADPGTIALDLAALLRIDPIDIDRRLARRPDSRYVVISEQLADWQIDAVRQAGMRGVGLEPRLVRHYPHVDLAAGVVGKVGFEHTGLAGFEHVFDQQMISAPGKLTYLRDVRRRALWIDPEHYEPGRNGQDIRLSIDLVVQELAEKRLRRAIEEYNAGGGRIVIMDCRSGELLALADFINHRRGWTEQIEDANRAIHPALGRNRCASDPYEPGSTFKPFIWSVATELGKAATDEVLPTPQSGGWRTPYGRLVHDAHYYGPMSWRMVLVKSMNTGMAMIAERMTPREMQDAVKRFGFGQSTKCGFAGESAGLVTAPRKWKTYTQTSVSMGHEIAVTPLQMVRAFSIFCRGDGTMTEPRITADQPTVKRPSREAADAAVNTEPQPAELTILRPVLKAQTIAIAREAMKGVMEEGTGRLAQSEKYQLFGKSGTAQLPRKDRKGYHQDRYVASFIAGAPYGDPRIIVLCVLDDPDPGRGHYGGAIAGPVVRDVVDEALTYLGIAPDVPLKAAPMVAAAH